MEPGMDFNSQTDHLPAPNPITQAAHKRAMRREFWMPFGAVFLLMLGLIVGLAINGVGTIEKWAQISTVLLVIGALVLGMVVLVILGGLVFLVSQVLRLLPPYARLAQNAIEKIETQIIAGANVSAQPIIEIESFLAMVNAVFGRNKRKS